MYNKNNSISKCAYTSVTQSNKLCYENLSNEELVKLYKLHGDSTAKEFLIKNNLNLIKKEAYKRRNFSSLDYDDLIQEGTIGLIRGIEGFNLEYNSKFSTYAYYWIIQVMERAIYTQGSLIRLPAHIIQKINKLSKIENQYLIHNKTNDPNQICKELNITIDEYNSLKYYLNYFKTCASLNKYVGENSDSDDELIDFISSSNCHLQDSNIDSTNTSIEQEILNKDLKQQIDFLLNSLKPREAIIVKLRFGIDCDKPHTLEEIGNIFSLTRERIRQIESSALRKLRHPSRTYRLKDFYYKQRNRP